MEIRPEAPADHPVIRALVDAAFGGTMESLLIDLIRASDRCVPDLALIAAADGVPVGHVPFSYVTIAGEEDHEVLSLAPLAVHPDHQGAGVGSALVEAGLARIAARRGLHGQVAECSRSPLPGPSGLSPRFLRSRRHRPLNLSLPAPAPGSPGSDPGGGR